MHGAYPPGHDLLAQKATHWRPVEPIGSWSSGHKFNHRLYLLETSSTTRMTVPTDNQPRTNTLPRSFLPFGWEPCWGHRPHTYQPVVAKSSTQLSN